VRPGSLSSPLVSSLNLYVNVESGVVDLLLILAAVASRDDVLPGRTSKMRIVITGIRLDCNPYPGIPTGRVGVPLSCPGNQPQHRMDSCELKFPYLSGHIPSVVDLYMF
jgi:hypothetical protein